MCAQHVNYPKRQQAYFFGKDTSALYRRDSMLGNLQVLIRYVTPDAFSTFEGPCKPGERGHTHRARQVANFHEEADSIHASITVGSKPDVWNLIETINIIGTLA